MKLKTFIFFVVAVFFCSCSDDDDDNKKIVWGDYTYQSVIDHINGEFLPAIEKEGYTMYGTLTDTLSGTVHPARCEIYLQDEGSFGIKTIFRYYIQERERHIFSTSDDWITLSLYLLPPYKIDGKSYLLLSRMEKIPDNFTSSMVINGLTYHSGYVGVNYQYFWEENRVYNVDLVALYNKTLIE